jgi:hypothetical protein
MGKVVVGCLGEVVVRNSDSCSIYLDKKDPLK